MKQKLKILIGDCRAELKKIAEKTAQTCVTSPPYYGLRSYLPKGHPLKHLEIGQEKTPQEYVEKIVAVFREVRRVLRDDGTLWLNLGDSYAGSGQGRMGDGSSAKKKGDKQFTNRGSCAGTVNPSQFSSPEMKAKDLMGIPWRVAFALQADGWYLRAQCPWIKRNPMPESCKDRPTTSIETIFLFTKSPTYFYDHAAVMKPSAPASEPRQRRAVSDSHKNLFGAPGQTPHSFSKPRENQNWKGSKFDDGKNLLIHPNVGKNRKEFDPKHAGGGSSMVGHSGNKKSNGEPIYGETRLRRSTDWFFESWEGMLSDEAGDPLAFVVNTKGYAESHFATFPSELIKPCILSGSKASDIVVDPFGGSGTTGLVSLELGRNAIVCELNDEYKKLIDQRTDVTPGLAI